MLAGFGPELARLAKHAGHHPSTVLRLVMALPDPTVTSAPEVTGVDLSRPWDYPDHLMAWTVEVLDWEPALAVRVGIIVPLRTRLTILFHRGPGSDGRMNDLTFITGAGSGSVVVL